MSFADDWAKESKNAIKAQREIVKVISIELFSGVITSSPVGNPALWKNPQAAGDGYTGGSFRSNWYLTKTVESVKYDVDRNISEGEAVSDIAKRIQGSESDSWILSNNAPYAQRIENGWSTQAPVGVVAPNVKRVESQIPRIAAIINKKYNVS